MTTDYHQKPIADMTPGELRAYRRDLARAALPAFLVRLEQGTIPVSDSFYYADAMIEHEGREEQGESHG